MTLTVSRTLGALLVSNLAAAGLFLGSAPAMASAGDPPPSPNLPRVAPATSLSAFSKGQLGVLDGTYQRAYLVAAWRVLAGAPLSERDLAALVNALPGDTGNAMENAKGEKPWPDARKQFTGSTEGSGYLSAGTFASANELVGLKDPGATENEYLTYSNCNFAATKAAAATLTARATQYGDATQNRWVKEWVTGQDQVFQACAGTYAEPSAAPVESPLWFKYDRQYQRAAALMYTGRFDDARKAFEIIAKDSQSPWAELAPYLAARVVLRQASLTVTPELRVQRLGQARQLFETLQRKGTPEQRRLAKPMLGRIAVELTPGAVLAKANERVGQAKWDADTGEHLGNLLTLIRKSVDLRMGQHTEAAASPYAVPADGSLADWMLAFGMLPEVNPTNGDWDLEHGTSFKALAEKAQAWCARAQDTPHQAAWSIVCLAGTAKQSRVPAAVWQYASKLPAKHPAYATVSYHMARLQLEELQSASTPAISALRNQLDQQLALGRAVYGADGLNAVQLLRARLATTLPEYLKLSTVAVVGEPALYAWYSDEARTVEAHTDLHPSAVAYVKYGMSVAELTQALNQPGVVPAEWRKAWVGMTWLRAAMLRQSEAEATLTPLLISAVPSLKTGLTAYANAADPAAKQFELVQLVLQHDVLDLARLEVTDWHWGTLRAPKVEGFRVLQPSAAAQKELAQLKRIGTYTDFVGETVLAYAALAPQDPRLPDALATVVALTRREAVTSPTLSRRAFTTLHKQYPQSKAAKRTKYWY